MAGNSSGNVYEHSNEDSRSFNSDYPGFDAFPRNHWANSSSQSIVSAQTLPQEGLNQEPTSSVTTVLAANEDNITVGEMPGPVLLTIDQEPRLPIPTAVSEVTQSQPVSTQTSSFQLLEAQFFAETRDANVTSTSRISQGTITSSQSGDQGQQSDHEETSVIVATMPSTSSIESNRTEISPLAHPTVANDLQTSSSNDSNLLVCTEELRETRSSLQDVRKTEEMTLVTVCKKHKEQLRYFCNSCQMSICENCWELDHQDATQHHVILFKFKLKQQNEIFDRIRKYEEQTTAIKQIMTKINRFLKDVKGLGEKQKDVIKSTNNEELMNRTQAVKEAVEAQIKSVESLQAEITEQLIVIEDNLRNLLKPESDKQLTEATSKETYDRKNVTRSGTVRSKSPMKERRNLKTLTRNFICEKEVWCKQAVYNSNREEIMCFDTFPDVLQVLRLNKESNSLILERRLEWEEVRRDECSVLWQIVMTSNNTLYASIQNIRDRRWRVSVLSQIDLSEEREIDTNAIMEPNSYKSLITHNSHSYEWHLSAFGNKLAFITMLHDNHDELYNCECVYIYSEETCIRKVRMDIVCKQWVYCPCYTGSHLIVQTSTNTLAVVPLDDIKSTEQNATTRESKKKKKKKNTQTEAGRLEESRATVIKYIYLLDTILIGDMVWVGRDYDELDGGMRSSSVDGYLFVGEYLDKCSVYELDLERIKVGDKINSRKDLEMKHMFPKCMINNLTLFAIQGKHIVNGKPSVIAYDYN